jgi:hypothetical protein
MIRSTDSPGEVKIDLGRNWATMEVHDRLGRCGGVGLSRLRWGKSQSALVSLAEKMTNFECSTFDILKDL